MSGDEQTSESGDLRLIRIAISYRREDTPGGAGRLRADLARHFGRDNVFFDIDSIPPGVDWMEWIDTTIRSCDVLLCVIGPYWLTVTDDKGRRRLDDPNDVLRFEIESALKARVRVLPIRLHGAAMPSADDVPPGLVGLTRRQAMRLDDDDWPDDLEKVISVLEKIQTDKAAAERAATERAAAERAATERAAAERAATERAATERAAAGKATVGTRRREKEERVHQRYWRAGIVLALGGIVGLLGVAAFLRAARDGDSSAWTRVSEQTDFNGSGDQRIQRLALSDQGLVAGGRDKPGGDMDAAVWTSAQGTEWQRIEDPDLSGSGAQEIWGVTAAGSLVVAVGSKSQKAAAWVSRDSGRHWDRPWVDNQSGESEMLRVTVGRSALVAVGHRKRNGDDDFAIWTAPLDGQSWLPADPAHLDGDQVLSGVAARGPGTQFVAVGYDDSYSRNRDAAVFYSDDGFRWQRADRRKLADSQGAQAMKAAIAGGPGWTAVGWDTAHGNSDAAVWTSNNGRDWTQVPYNESVFGGARSQQMLEVTSDRFLVAVGTDGQAGRQDAAVWITRDGRNWQRDTALRGERGAAMTGVVTTGSRIVAVGWDNRGQGDFDAAAWTRPNSDD